MEGVTAIATAGSADLRGRLLLGAGMLVAFAPVWSTAGYSIAIGAMLAAWLWVRPWRRPGWRPPFLVGSAMFAGCLAAAVVAAPALGAGWEEFRSYYPFLLLFFGADAARDPAGQRAIGKAFLCSAAIAAAAAVLSALGAFDWENSRFRGTVGIFEYAYAMVIGWSLSLWIFLRARRRAVAAAGFALSLLFLPAIILNATRASLVAGLAALLVIAALGWRSWPRLLLLFAPLLAAAPFAMDSELGARLLNADKEFRLEHPQSQRQVIWAHAWALFEDHPWIGAGPGSFAASSAALKGDPRLDGYPRLRHPYQTAHSIPLHLLATAGLAGLLGFLVWIADVAKRFLRGLRVDLDASAPALISLAVLLSFGATDMSLLNTRISGLFCLALGVSAGALRGAGTRSAAAPIPIPGGERPGETPPAAALRVEPRAAPVAAP